MKVLKGYKYRLRPKSKELKLLSQFAGCARYAYNRGLERKKCAHEEGKRLRYFDQNKELTVWRKEIDWLASCHSQVLQQSLKDLDRAFEHFFRRLREKKTPGFPRFKRRGDRDSFRYPQGFKIEDNRVFLPKIGWMRFRKSREIPGSIKDVTVMREGDNWNISFSVEIEIEEKLVPLCLEKAIGIDLGCKSFATIVGPEVSTIEHPQYLKKQLSRIQKYGRVLSKKTYKSKNYFKFKKKLAKLHRKVKNVRADFLHKSSTDLVKNHDLICVEDLCVKRMLEEGSRSLSRKIADSGWRNFLDFLKYKAIDLGKRVVEVSPYFPSTKLCSSCGHKQMMPLSLREYHCACGLSLDRDVNAALNIKAAGTSVIACGVGITQR